MYIPGRPWPLLAGKWLVDLHRDGAAIVPDADLAGLADEKLVVEDRL